MRMRIFFTTLTVNSSFNTLPFLFRRTVFFKLSSMFNKHIPQKHTFSTIHTINATSEVYLLKQSSSSVLSKKCSKNMYQIYRRTAMPKCHFNKVVLQLYQNHTSTWLFSCKFPAYFQNIFSYEHGCFCTNKVGVR